MEIFWTGQNPDTNIKFKIIKHSKSGEDLPVTTILIGAEKQSKVVVSMLYQEFTSGVSVFSSIESQRERLRRLCSF